MPPKNKFRNQTLNLFLAAYLEQIYRKKKKEKPKIRGSRLK
jgi:hypothetical protein